jgi:ABC-2 type transport system ATP-binding protein
VADAIQVEGLTKDFGATRALDGLDFVAEAGRILGILGPNGAGKTTAVRILTTLLRPDAGRAMVAGFDVVLQPAQVRRRISLTGQYAAIDDRLSGRENLELVGALYHLRGADVRSLAGWLLERLDLIGAADRPVQTYSGGMRRRLDLAAGILPPADVVVLDEPTTGLDLQGRLAAWELIEELARRGTTVLLTTQNLAEAEQLASQIVVIDRGRVAAEGTAAELKARLGAERLVIGIGQGSDLTSAARVLDTFGGDGAAVDWAERRIAITLANAGGMAARVARALDEVCVEIIWLEIRQPTLDDAFLALTGHQTLETTEPAA